MNYFRLLRSEGPLLWFGLISALSTSVGQSFFIALSIPSFLQAFEMGDARFGAIYSAATLGGAVLLPVSGAWIDRISLPKYTAAVTLGLALSAFLIAWSPHLIVLTAGLVGVRMLGKGLMAHVSQTAMAREFGANRGKALGFASLGYPLGEAFLPALFAYLLVVVSWRVAWLMVAGVFLFAVLPGLLLLLRTARGAASTSTVQIEEPQPQFQRRWIWRDWRLYGAMPAVLAMPFVQTGLFLYQLPLAESKGWSATLIATAFTAYAVSRAVASVVVGPLIDRYRAGRLLPLYLLPNALGMMILFWSDAAWIAPVYLVLVGMTSGCSSSIKSAVWAEYYGPQHVGTVRSAISAMAVMSTGVTPALAGYFLEQGVSIPSMLLVGICVLVSASLLAIPASPWVDHERAFARIRGWGLPGIPRA